jgi:hypothetical protein
LFNLQGRQACYCSVNTDWIPSFISILELLSLSRSCFSLHQVDSLLPTRLRLIPNLDCSFPCCSVYLFIHYAILQLFEILTLNYSPCKLSITEDVVGEIDQPYNAISPCFADEPNVRSLILYYKVSFFSFSHLCCQIYTHRTIRDCCLLLLSKVWLYIIPYL